MINEWKSEIGSNPKSICKWYNPENPHNILLFGYENLKNIYL